MKVILVQPSMNWPHPYCDAPSTALLMLGTLAKRKGHNVKILHLDVDDVSFEQELKTFKPEIVGITVNTFQVKSARKLARQARKAKAKVIVGGPHAVVWDGFADQIVIGEGENKWLEILGEKPVEINDIPFPDYTLVNLDKFCGIGPLVGASPSFCMMASRGCPFNCIYCNTPAFWGKTVRYRDPQNVVDEMEYLHKKWGAREIFIQDDTFNINHKWAFQIFEDIIKRGLNKEMIFRIAGRVNEKLLTPEFLDLAVKAGVWNIFYGLESGSQLMLDKMKKGITVGEITKAIELIREKKLSASCSFIVGLPGETWATLMKTGLMTQRLRMSPFINNEPIRYGWGYACPFPATEFEKTVKEKGHIREMDYGDYTYGPLMCRTDELTFEDLEKFQGFNPHGSMPIGTKWNPGGN